MRQVTINVTKPANGVDLLTLNAPERLNAFNFAMYDQLIEELRRIRHDATVRVVIVTGAGKGFCSGHFSGGAGQPSWVDPALGKIPHNARTMAVLSEIPLLLRQLPQPVIAAVNGAAAGVGYSLVLAADLAIAGSSAKFVNAFHNAGTGHELGLSYMLPRAVGTQRAAELLFTRRPVLADEAAHIGLVLRTVPDATLMNEALALAEAIKVNHPMGIWYTKQSLHLNESAPSLAAAIELENRAVHLVQATGDFAEMREAAVAKRPVEFKNQ
jgi:enoyl-CoA hydratase